MQANCVPPGTVLGCTLFIVKMNLLGKTLLPTISYSIYVDDVQTSFKSCNLSICECQMQFWVNKRAHWADQIAFKLNPAKSTCIVFSNRCRIHADPDINSFATAPIQNRSI